METYRIKTTITKSRSLALKDLPFNEGENVEVTVRRTAVQREQTLKARQKIEQEQEWWLNQPLKERAKYEGEFIAVHDQKLVDHDKDEAALYKRIRAKYGKTPVLVMPADGPGEIHIYSPRVGRA